MASIFELRTQREHALNKAQSIVSAAETAKRPLTDNEQMEIDTAMLAVQTLNPRIAEIEKNNTVTKMLGTTGGRSVLLIDGARRFQQNKTVTLSADYPDAFFSYIQSGGKRMDAALYEGAEGAGGYAVPITVSDQIVPLAPNEMSVRRLAQVIPTAMDIKIPQKSAFGQASAKAENSAFTEIDPTLSQITLSAYMAGIQEVVSWELAQDVPAFQAFAVDDMILAQQMYEENLYVNGTGSGQAQGLIGNVGAGVTEEPDSNGNLVSVNGTLDLIGKLNAIYHPNASWLMNRTTSIILRKARFRPICFSPPLPEMPTGRTVYTATRWNTAPTCRQRHVARLRFFSETSNAAMSSGIEAVAGLTSRCWTSHWPNRDSLCSWLIAVQTAGCVEVKPCNSTTWQLRKRRPLTLRGKS